MIKPFQVMELIEVSHLTEIYRSVLLLWVEFLWQRIRQKILESIFLNVLQYLLWQRIAKNTQNKILDIMVTKKNGNKQNPWISLRGMCPPPRWPDASQDYPSGWIIIPFFHQKPNELRNYLVRFLAKRCLRWCMIVTLCMSQQRPEKSGLLWKPG